LAARMTWLVLFAIVSLVLSDENTRATEQEQAQMETQLTTTCPPRAYGSFCHSHHSLLHCPRGSRAPCDDGFRCFAGIFGFALCHHPLCPVPNPYVYTSTPTPGSIAPTPTNILQTDQPAPQASTPTTTTPVQVCLSITEILNCDARTVSKCAPGYVCESQKNVVGCYARRQRCFPEDINLVCIDERTSLHCPKETLIGCPRDAVCVEGRGCVGKESISAATGIASPVSVNGNTALKPIVSEGGDPTIHHRGYYQNQEAPPKLVRAKIDPTLEFDI